MNSLSHSFQDVADMEPCHIATQSNASVAIQPHGCLLVIDDRLIVRNVSANLEVRFGLRSDEVIGHAVTEFVSQRLGRIFRSLFKKREVGLTVNFGGGLRTCGRIQMFNGQAHYNDGVVLLELEEAVDADRHHFFEDFFIPIRDKLWALDSETSIERYMSAVAYQIGALTGIDRVMVYRFDSDGDAEVVAEHLNQDVASFLGHHFPASDIPLRVREIYSKNRLRLISDVYALSSVLVPAQNSVTGRPVDLTYCALRSSADWHLDYLRNMGVAATFSISLVTNGRLWGLIAGHHYSAFKLPPYLRELADFVGRTASLKILGVEQAELQGKMQSAEIALEQLGDLSSYHPKKVAVQDDAREKLLSLMGAAGAVVSVAKRKFYFGQTPDVAFINHLVDWLRAQSNNSVYATDALPRHFSLAGGVDPCVTGLLASPSNEAYENYVLWFRPAIMQTIRWAGNPERCSDIKEDGSGALRTSFAAWLQTYSERSAKWSFADIDLGQRISLALMTQVVERHIKQSHAVPARDIMLPDAKTIIGCFDERFAYAHISANVMELLGFKGNELISHPVVDFVFEDDIPRVTRYLLRAMTEHTDIHTVTFRHCCKDGRYVWMELWASRHETNGATRIDFTATDVTERQLYNAGLEDIHRRYHRILEGKMEGVLTIDGSRHILHASETACELLGYHASDLIGLDYCAALCSCRNCSTSSMDHCHSVMMKHGTGMKVAADVMVIPLLDSPPGEPSAFVIFRRQDDPGIPQQTIIRLIGRQEPNPAEGGTPMASVEGCCPIGVLVTDRNGTIQSVNAGFTGITGYSSSEAVGRAPGFLRSDVHSQEFYTHLWQSLAAHRMWRGEIWNRRKSGEVYPQFTNIFAILDKAGRVRNYASVFRDVSTSASASNERSHEKPEHDPLTGLPTRLLFERSVHQVLASNQATFLFAIAFLDIENFDEINDALGHLTGDRLLYLIASRLSSRLRRGDLVGRWGGKKFMLFLPGVKNNEDGMTVLKRHLASLEQPFSISGISVQIRARAGMSLHPRDGMDLDTLIRAANLAQGHAKKQGAGPVVIYEAALAEATAHRFELATDLRQAIRTDQLFLVYQPQVNAETGDLVGLEALVRWKHPTRGLIPPVEFIKVAEDNEMMDELGTVVFNLACQQIRSWLDQGVLRVPVGINVSPSQLKPGLAEQMKSVMDGYDIPSELIEIEITESALLPTGLILSLVQEIKDIGVSLAIDDFGTGYSSLSHLKHFPFDRLKIDKSFVDGLPMNEKDQAIIEAIDTLGRALRVNVIAEGVELLEQANCLRTKGVHIIQGYLYSRPLPATELEEYWASQHRRETDPHTSLLILGCRTEGGGAMNIRESQFFRGMISSPCGTADKLVIAASSRGYAEKVAKEKAAKLCWDWIVERCRIGGDEDDPTITVIEQWTSIAGGEVLRLSCAENQC